MVRNFILASFASVLVALPAYADKIPDLVGTWICSGKTVSKVEGRPAEFGIASETIRIDEQEQSAFHGVAIVEYDGAQHEEPFVGMLSSNKKYAIFIEAEGYKEWKLTGKNRALISDDEHGTEYLMIRRGTCQRQPK